MYDYGKLLSVNCELNDNIFIDTKFTRLVKLPSSARMSFSVVILLNLAFNTKSNVSVVLLYKRYVVCCHLIQSE